MKKNGYTMIELLVVIIVLGVITAVTLGTTSYAFKDHSDEYYEQKTNVILRQAENYGQTLETLKDDGHIIITVNDLIKEGFVSADENGNVVDPRNSKATLNGLKIKIVYNEGEIKASLIED